jgi:hypothetical protein
VTDERLNQCRSRLEGVAERPLDAQAEALELVHQALVAELDDLRDGERDSRRP